MINYIFLKALAMENSNMQQYLQHFQKINLYWKLKMCKFSLEASLQKSMQNFIVNIVQSVFFCLRLSKEV